MNITDLEFCEFVEFDNRIIGSAQTYANAKTSAGKGIAFAQSYADAFGDDTSAITKTRTTVRESSFSSFSYASASADARAKDDNGYSRSSYDSISIWISAS